MAKKAITEENLNWAPIAVNRKHVFKYGILRELLFYKENEKKFSIIITFDDLGYHLSESGGFRFKGSFSSFEEARKSIEDFIKADLNDSYLNLPDVEDFGSFGLSRLNNRDGFVSLFRDFFNKEISFPKDIKLEPCNILREKTFDEWLGNYREFQKCLNEIKPIPQKPKFPSKIQSRQISNSDEAKARMASLGFSDIFLEIADGVIPVGLFATKVDRFYSILPVLRDTFAPAENYLPLWEVNQEAVVAFDLKRRSYVRLSFEDGKTESLIADSYQEFIAETLARTDETGCPYADLENLAIRFEFSRFREFQAFRVRRRRSGGTPPRFGEYLSLRETAPDEFIREEIRDFLADRKNDLNLKGEIIQNLEADFANPLVSEFFLEVISNPEESHLARIEALIILQVREISTPESKAFIGRRLVEVIRDDSNEEIQKWAGIAARNYAQAPEVQAALVEVIANPTSRKCAKINCLSAIEAIAPSPQIIARLESLRKDRKIGRAIKDTLAGWASRQPQ